MAKRQGNRLSAVQIGKLAKRPGLHNDGHGLYLETRDGRCCWRFRYKFFGTPKWIGLGPVHSVSLVEARERARQARQLILDGKDPLAVKREAVTAAMAEQARTWTFEQAAVEFMRTDKIEGLKNAKHKAQWLSTLKTYCFPVFGDLPLQQIDSAIVLKALLAAWKKTPETGSRLRGRIERVFGWAKPLGLYTGENPASREALKDHLPKKAKAKHHPALAYADIAAFMAKLIDRDSVSARALELTILTAARTNETIGARWSEIDLKAATWTIPGDRMKAGKTHVVPLSDRAVEILRGIAAHRGAANADHVFINGGGLPLSNQAMSEMVKGFKLPSTTPGKLATVHGFRSTFSDWAHDRTAFTPDVIEHALAHVVGNKVAAAYRRGDAFDKRRQLMAAWAKHCQTPATGATVQKIGAARRA